VTDPKQAVSLRDWVQGARLRTLPLAVGPVLLGSTSAWTRGELSPVLSVLALLVAVALQVGVNYANDYSDGVRGADSNRVGPQRLTGSGRVSPERVKNAAIFCLAVAMVAGGTLVLLASAWWMLLVGALALWAAWTYTGGTRPYGYRGLGEFVVFVFFGPVATLGTAYVHLGLFPLEAWVTGAAVGFFASAVLLENNLRDRETDQLVGKRTLSVLFGVTVSKNLTTAFLLAPYVLFFVLAPSMVGVLVALVPGLLSVWALIIVWRGSSPQQLVAALQLTSLNSLIFSIALSAALLV